MTFWERDRLADYDQPTVLIDNYVGVDALTIFGVT